MWVWLSDRALISRAILCGPAIIGMGDCFCVAKPSCMNQPASSIQTGHPVVDMLNDCLCTLRHSRHIMHCASATSLVLLYRLVLVISNK